jgi:DNA-binding NarL/FixJ family response regulator
MPAAQGGSVPTYGDLTVAELLELVLEARGSRLERHLLAATLRSLATWLGDQSRMLLGEEVDNSAAPLHVVPSRSRAADVLTRRECDVARCVARGLSNRQIAHELVITISTTERHIANILSKLGMRSRTQIAAWAAVHGLV